MRSYSQTSVVRFATFIDGRQKMAYFSTEGLSAVPVHAVPAHNEGGGGHTRVRSRSQAPGFTSNHYN